MWNRVLLMVILSISTLGAQVPNGRFQLSGRIAQSGSLALAPPDSRIQNVQAATSDARQLHVRVMPGQPGRSVLVSLIARSNAPYSVLAAANAEPLRVVVQSVHPNGGTAHLTSDATNVRSVGDVVEGPRISSGGNDASIDNAIRLTLEVQLPGNISEGELVLTMGFPY